MGHGKMKSEVTDSVRSTVKKKMEKEGKDFDLKERDVYTETSKFIFTYS